MCIKGDSLCIIALIITFINFSTAFRVSNYTNGLSGSRKPIFVKHIDDMMFECAIYKDKLTFPSNSNLSGSLEHSKGKQADELFKKVADEVEKARQKTKLIKSNINRIKFPIVGRTTKPETKYLQKIYYILEENNRSLNENKLSETDKESPKTRVLILPRNINKIFDSNSITKCVNIFPTFLTSKSPLLPGQESTMILHEEHKEFLVNEIRENNIFGIFVTFVTKYDENLKKPEVLPNATLCEFVDITQLDTSGKITVKGIDRFRIGNVITISDAVIKAEVSLLRDSGILRNPPIVEENCKVIEKLYDRCNLLESEYRKLDGNMEDVAVIDSRDKFGDKINKLIEHVDIEKDRNMIYELTAFAGLEYHADLETKAWAINTDDTEQRLVITIDVLKTKIEYLNNMIKEKMNNNKINKIK